MLAITPYRRELVNHVLGVSILPLGFSILSLMHLGAYFYQPLAQPPYTALPPILSWFQKAVVLGDGKLLEVV